MHKYHGFAGMYAVEPSFPNLSVKVEKDKVRVVYLRVKRPKMANWICPFRSVPGGSSLEDKNAKNKKVRG